MDDTDTWAVNELAPTTVNDDPDSVSDPVIVAVVKFNAPVMVSPAFRTWFAVILEKLTPPSTTRVAVAAQSAYVPVADDGITGVTSAALGIAVKLVPVSVGAPHMAPRVMLDAITDPPSEPAATFAEGKVILL